MSTLLQVCLSLILVPWLVSAFSNLDPAMLRSYFGCAPCDQNQCRTPTGCELIKESGICGCCYVCALQEGDACGVMTAPCGEGLQCRPYQPSSDDFAALFKGKGFCLRNKKDESAWDANEQLTFKENPETAPNQLYNFKGK